MNTALIDVVGVVRWLVRCNPYLEMKGNALLIAQSMLFQ